MISSARHHHRPACSQQHAARLSRASIATCHLRRRIVLHISCRPILGTATIHEIKLFKRCGHNSGATPFPAPGAPRPNLHHTRLPGGSRCGSCVAGVMRGGGHAGIRAARSTKHGCGWRVFSDRGFAVGEPGACVKTAACSPKSRRVPLLTYTPAPLHHRRHSFAAAPASIPPAPARSAAQPPPPLRQAKRRHTAALDCRAGRVRCGLWTPVLRDPPGRGGAMPPASS
jgi:hypothetical protein